MIRANKPPAAIYPYRDAAGRVVYQLLRYQPKHFEWVTASRRAWGSRRRRPLLYRLPELLAADRARPVYVVEGEKDVDRLRSVGLVATCNDGGGGQGKWRRSHSMPLRGRSVVIIPDNDKTGEEHAQDVAGRLWRLAASVRLVKLPRLPRKGDVSDWLDAGGTAENLETLSTTVAHWTPRPPTFQVSSDFSDLYDMALKLERLFVAPLSPMEKLFVVIVTWRRGILSQQTLATYLRVSPRRIRQLVADLKERGVLQVSRRGRRNNYSVQMHALS